MWLITKKEEYLIKMKSYEITFSHKCTRLVIPINHIEIGIYKPL